MQVAGLLSHEQLSAIFLNVEELAEVNKQQIGTKLFAESDEQDSDDTGTVDKSEGGSNVLADPTGKTQGQLLVGKRKGRKGGS